jgi:valyl-tRNA synthetase
LPDADGRFLMEGRYPAPGPVLDAAETAEMDRFAEIIGKIRQVRGELDLPPSTLVRVVFPTTAEPMVRRHEAALRALTRASEPQFSDSPPPATASVLWVGDWQVRVELGDPKLLQDELRRLEKTLVKLDKDLAFVATKLDNPSFAEKAKPEVVAAEREKHERYAREREVLQTRLERLRRAAGAPG